MSLLYGTSHSSPHRTIFPHLLTSDQQEVKPPVTINLCPMILHLSIKNRLSLLEEVNACKKCLKKKYYCKCAERQPDCSTCKSSIVTCECAGGQAEVEKLKEKYRLIYSKIAKKVFPSSVPIPLLGKASSNILGLMVNNDVIEPSLHPSLKCQVDNEDNIKEDKLYKPLERYELERLCAVAKVTRCGQ